MTNVSPTWPMKIVLKDGIKVVEEILHYITLFVLTFKNHMHIQPKHHNCVNAHFGKFSADLSKESDTERLLESTMSKFGRLDILVNNAGVAEMGNIENTSLDQYDRVMGVNMRSVYHLTMLATPHLVESKGNVVNVSRYTNNSVSFAFCQVNPHTFTHMHSFSISMMGKQPFVQTIDVIAGVV